MSKVFKCFHVKKQPIEIYTANSSYEAQCKAAELWNMKPSKRHEITVMLAEKDGQPVVNSTSGL